jgi:hypothetical protein
LIAIAEFGPGLNADEAENLATVVYPIAEGTLPQSAPEELTSHPNPKRARSRFSRRASIEQLRAAALQAAARLTLHEQHPKRLEQALVDALASNERDRVRIALRTLADRPALDLVLDVEPLVASDDRGVRDAANLLKTARASAR